MKRVFWSGVLLGLLAFDSVQAACCTNIPSQPDPVVVRPGIPGGPVGFICEDDEDYGAGRTQLEMWRASGASSTLYTRVWVNDDTVETWTGTNYFVNSSGDRRVLPGGTYTIRQRGWTGCGYGPWSVGTRFTIRCPARLTAPRVFPVSPTRDFSFRWTNNYGASSYQVEVRKGSRVVRTKTITPGLGYGYFGGDGRGDSYEPYATSPARDLPEGSGYLFRLRAYSACLGRWSSWTSSGPWTIRQPMPARPVLSMTQKDTFGWAATGAVGFLRSPRPYFMVGTNGPVARWHYFDIRKRGSMTPVKQVWNKGPVIGGADDWEHAIWSSDLAPGDYVWKVKAWNSPTKSVWSGWKTSRVVPSGTLTAPSVTSGYFSVDGCYPWQNISWHATPNAYTYRVQLMRNGSNLLTTAWLDNGDLYRYYSSYNRRVSVSWSFERPVLASGTYKFRVQARSRSNTGAAQYSPWSAWSSDQQVSRTTGSLTDLYAFVYGSSVYMIMNEVGTVCKVQVQAFLNGCSTPYFDRTEGYIGSVHLPPGAYTWRARPWSQANGYGAWVNGPAFVISP